MPTFLWKGKTAGGETTAGEMVAENRSQLVQMLRKRRISVVNVREKPKGLSIPLLNRKSVSVKEMAIFTRQFATMIDAGLPLVQCLDTIAKQSENKYLKEVLVQVTQDVEAGSTLADALRKQPKVFNNLYTNMVEAGEAGGALDDILERLAVHIEKAEALRRKVKGALTYPLVVAGVAILASVFMLVFIIPTFARMFSDFGAALPLPTRTRSTIPFCIRTAFAPPSATLFTVSVILISPSIGPSEIPWSMGIMTMFLLSRFISLSIRIFLPISAIIIS